MHTHQYIHTSLIICTVSLSCRLCVCVSLSLSPDRDSGPRVEIVDGKIVLKESSLVSKHAPPSPSFPSPLLTIHHHYYCYCYYCCCYY